MSSTEVLGGTPPTKSSSIISVSAPLSFCRETSACRLSRSVSSLRIFRLKLGQGEKGPREGSRWGETPAKVDSAIHMRLSCDAVNSRDEFPQHNQHGKVEDGYVHVALAARAVPLR